MYIIKHGDVQKVMLLLWEPHLDKKSVKGAYLEDAVKVIKNFDNNVE